MMRIRLLLLTAAALLAGCANTTKGECAKNSICPIVIYEKFPGFFGTYPDHMSVKTGGLPQTLLWTFADTTKYKFVASTDFIAGDGVELIDANGNKIGLTPCFVTRRSKDEFKPATEGSFYRCDVVANKDFASVRYRIRFRTTDGSPRMVDPTVSSSGGGDQDEDPKYTSISVNVGADVTLPAKAAGVDGFRVIWNSSTGAEFRRASTPMVLKDKATGLEVGLSFCSPSQTADGLTPQQFGQYYMCIFTTAKSLALTYEARYIDSGVFQTRAGNVTRP